MKVHVVDKEQEKMNYLDLYRRRAANDGVTAQDRIENRLARDFEQLLQRSPNRITILWDDKKYDALLQSGNSRVGTQTERKVIQYLLTPTEYKMPEGTKFYTQSEKSGEQKWLVLHREIHPYDGYFKYKVIELNWTIKYINAQGVLKTLDTYINGTGEFDIKEYFLFSDPRAFNRPTRALNLIYQQTPDITVGCYFYIGRETWHYIDADEISIPGVAYGTIFQSPSDDQHTDREEKIAHTDMLNTSTIVCGRQADNDVIELALGLNDTEFFIDTKGRILDGAFTYQIGDRNIIEMDGTKIVPLQNGETTITVTSDIGLEKTFKVIVANMKPYVNLLGNNSIRLLHYEDFRVYSTYIHLEFEVEDESYGSVDYDKEKNILRFKANRKIGSTKILMWDEGVQVGELEVYITSLAI